MPAMSFIFEPDVLARIAKDALGQPLEVMVEQIAEQLEREYPGHIRDDREWVLNNAGGAMGMMTVLHASITEYVIIFGTPIGTEGHTGRFWAEDYFFILEGEQWAYSEASPVKEIYRPGDLHVLPQGVAQGYRMPDRCFALEYARGFIPAMLPFGLADTMFGTLDWRTLGRTLSKYGASSIKELMQGKI
ncbi:ERG2 and Sigma1 receptor like protein [Enhygromyxa salina]|uniref:ERG2 and Sigma1 receptor like protein n=2 Tax=Enhygromyxa salina TaxID=215803 RepID=A0A2S9YC11_9BACT|nr:ERG2 and Sigma1 receptor like protein [Enhygromyxa salina]